VRCRARAVLALAIVLGGCGYSVNGTLPADVKTIAVPIFQNLTREPGVEGLVTRAVVEAFSTNGRLKIASAADADTVLDGEVIGYSVFSIAFDKDANVRQYRLIVTVNLQLRDRRKNEVLFKQSGVREQVDFRVQNAVSQTISLEETALKAAAVEIGRTIASLTVTRF
jgi:outer membrane lipopolysaccharide assembly protein LptE/RlpB